MLRHAGATSTLLCLAILGILVASALSAAGSNVAAYRGSAGQPSGVLPSAALEPRSGTLSHPDTRGLPHELPALPTPAWASRSRAGSAVSHPASLFPASVDLSQAPASGFASGGPPAAPNPNPSIAEDSTGTIYVAWSANDTTSGHWLIYFSKSTDGSSFTAPVVVGPAPGTNVNDVSPAIAVSGANVAVVYETMTGYSGDGGYQYMLSTNGGTSFTSEGTQAKWGDTNLYAPAVAFGSNGNVFIAYWGADALDCATYYVNDLVVDEYTAGTTYTTSLYGCLLNNANAAYLGTESIACAPTGADCSVIYAYSASGTTFVVDTQEFSDTAGAASAGATLVSNTFAPTDTQVTSFVGGNDLVFTGATSAIAAWEHDSASPPTYTYVMGYSSTANDWTAATAQTSPSGSAAAAGAAIGTAGNGDVILSWEDVATSTVQTAWANAAGGTFTTASMIAPGSLGSAPSVSGTTSVAPYRLDFVWVNDTPSPSAIYYTHFIGLGATASAAPTTVDLWTPVAFTATPTNGAPAYAYAWNFGGACSPACPTTTQNPSVNYTAPGSYAASVTVTDAIGETATASAGTITVNPRLLVSVAPTTASVDVGQALTFTATPAGGSGTYSAYTWKVNGASQAGTTATLSYTFATAGTITVSVAVTDSLGTTSPAAGATITVGSALALTGIKASPNPTLPGTVVTFTPTVSGGTTPYTYAWSLGGGVLSASANPTNTYSASGNYTVYLNLTDAATGAPPATASAVTYVLVDSAMTVSALAQPTNAITGQTIFFNGTASGGTPAYTWAWTFGDGTATSGTANQKATHTYSAAGTYTAHLFVNDSVMQMGSATATVTVLAPLSITESSATNPGVVGTAVNFQGTATGGLSPYTFTWNFGDSSPTATGAATSHTYQTAGSYPVTLTVVDSASPAHSASKTMTQVINPKGGSGGSLVVTLTPFPASLIVGGTVTFSATIGNGAANYVLSWNFGDGSAIVPGSSTSSSVSTTHVYSQTGTFTAYLFVNDSSSPVRGGYASNTVTVLPLGSFTDSIQASRTIVDVGEAVTITGQASGGSGTYPTFLFSFGDGTAQSVPGGSASQESATHAYANPGTYNVYVNVTDTSSPARSASASLQIVVDPKVSVVVSAPAASVDAYSNTIFTATPSGGSSSYTGYAWYFGTASSIPGSQQQGQTFSSAGLYQIEAAVTDTNGGVGYGFMNLTVNPPVQVTVTGTPNNQAPPMCVSFVATASGGLGPYHYAWSFGDGSNAISTTNNWTHCYQTSGQFDAVVVVTDTVSGSGTGWLNSTVSAKSPTGIGTQVLGNWWWLLIVLVAVAALLLLLIIRRRKPRQSLDGEVAFGGGGLLMGGAGAAAVPIDDLAPAVPPGASDASPDDLGGVEDGSAPTATSELPPATAMGQLGTGGAPSIIPSCPRCGTALMGEGLPCPSCQYVASSAELAAAAAATMATPSALEVSAPSTSPSNDTLSHCPQCAAPLAPDNSCPVCQVRWEPSAASVGGSGIGVLPSTSSTPLAVAQGPSQELTHCPQCGTVLSAGRICPKCQVSWEPHAQSPPGLSDSPGTSSDPTGSAPSPSSGAEEFPVPPPPMVTEVRRGGEAIADDRQAAVPSPPPSLPPPPSAEPAPLFVVSPPPPPPPAPEAPTSPSPGPEPQLAPSPSGGGGRTRCFICDGPLENGYCANCNMSWSD